MVYDTYEFYDVWGCLLFHAQCFHLVLRYAGGGREDKGLS